MKIENCKLKIIFLVLFLLPFSVLAFTVPQNPTGFVQDYAGMLSADEISQLETKLQNFEKATTNEIAVVTISSLDGDVIENVAQDIFTKWGIGKKDKNNGVLLLISLADRKTRIQTGYGVEGDLTDIATSYIQSDIITPAFRDGKYFDGINGAVDKMIEALGGNNIVPENYPAVSNVPWGLVAFSFIVIFQMLSSLLGSSRSWWGGGVLGGVIGIALWHFILSPVYIGLPVVVILILIGLLFDFIVSRAYAHKSTTGRFPPWFFWGGGGFGGGGGGGGFGGFGGGGSGGGGSSGSW